MPTNGNDRLDRIERLVQQDAENIHALARIAEAHQATIEKHQTAIEATNKNIEKLQETVAQLVREWQAYLRRQPAN